MTGARPQSSGGKVRSGRQTQSPIQSGAPPRPPKPTRTSTIPRSQGADDAAAPPPCPRAQSATSRPATPRASGGTGRGLCVLHEPPHPTEYTHPSSSRSLPSRTTPERGRNPRERPRPSTSEPSVALQLPRVRVDGICGDLAGLLKIRLHAGGDPTCAGGCAGWGQADRAADRPQQRSLLVRFGRRSVEQPVTKHLDYSRTADATKMCNMISIAGCKPSVEAQQTKITCGQT